MERDYYVFVIELLFAYAVSMKGLCKGLFMSGGRGKIGIILTIFD